MCGGGGGGGGVRGMGNSSGCYNQTSFKQLVSQLPVNR